MTLLIYLSDVPCHYIFSVSEKNIPSECFSQEMHIAFASEYHFSSSGKLLIYMLNLSLPQNRTTL